MRSSFGGILLGLLVAGCGGMPPAPAQPRAEGFAHVERVEPAGLARDPAQPLRLQPGDVVMLRTVSAETAAYEGLVVSETGMLHVPLAGDVEVGGLTLTEAEQRVQEALRRFDTVVVANLFVTDPAGHRVSVIGAVVEPGRVQLTPGMRVADLLAEVGGPLMEVTGAESVVMANLHGARLVRNGEAVPVSLPRALEGNPRHNVRVRPGDTLYIPPTMGTRISVLGQVAEPTVVPYREGLRLTEALALASGINIDGDRGDIRIIRGDFRNPRVYTASLWDLKEGETHDVILAPGDVIFVTEHWMASVGEVLDRLSPILSSGTAFGVTFAVTRN